MNGTAEDQAFAGKAALVTGASRNIGRAIALEFARAAGASVLINGRSDEAAAREVAREVAALGVSSAVHMADIGQEEEAEALVESAVAEFGRLDFVILNAAVRRQTPVAEISYQEWREVVSVSLDGAFLVSRAAIPHLAASDGGRIVLLGGSPSHLGSKGRAHVCAAKMGVVGLTRVLANELGEQGVTANCIAPGHIDTVRGASAGQILAVASGRPIQRPGMPEEVAAAVRFLCSKEAAYITGQTLHVNGGMLFAGA